MIVLKATQDKVLAVLQSVAGIVERRHTLPILANVLIRKTGNALQLTTSDLEIQIRTTAELGGDTGDFTTTVGARKLIDILKTMPGDQTVSLESQQSKLILKGGKSRFTLQSLPAEDFPLVQESAAFGPVFAVPQKTLKDLLGQVSFAMAVQDIRYYLNGILFVAEGKTLSLVATDGHRLAFASATLDVEVPKQEVILPRKTGSTWNGMRRASTPASAIRPSLPLPSEAPVIRVRLKGSCRARSASARGRALASPARVNPLMPTRMPLWNNLAASSALMILPSKPGWRIRSSYIVMLLIFLIFSNWMAVIHQPHKWIQYKIPLTCMV